MKESRERRCEVEFLSRFLETIKKISMQMSIYDQEEWMWSLHRDQVQALRAEGYGYLPDTKPHIAIEHTLSRLKPKLLHTRMKDIMTWRKDEQFQKKDFNVFMREVSKQAKTLQEEGGL